MKRWIWIAAALVVAAVAGSIFLYNTDDAKDRRVWRRFTAELTDANVTKVEFGGTKLMTLTEADRRELLALLREAAFDRSNRAGEGPTPQAVISVTFKDGKQVNIGMWGWASYELSPRHLDANAQFLIKNEKLGVWLKNHFAGPSIGAAGQTASGVSFFRVCRERGALNAALS
ncbi:MAG TPA: hypothetical protein VNT75_28005 [Symbiobacteriaceae bacterium]|nr:hypothetical protein [Symbiobacteriaceae bacterium]